MNFSFGSNTPKTTAGLTFSTPANPGTASTGIGTTGLTFGSTPTASVTGFSLGGAGDSKSTTQTAAIKPIATATPLSTSFSLGAPPAVAPATTSAAPATSTTGFSFGAPASATPNLTTTSSAISFSLTPASTTSTPLKLGTATTTPILGLGLVTTLATTTSTTLSTTAPATAAAPQNAISFIQLEETISKWTHELEEQEKIFMSQAAQINNWDNLLNSNSEKIVALDAEVQAMKVVQHQLDNELDFILAQQRELEEVLAPLEKQAAEMPSNTDPEREHTYHMAETLDTQLKQMSEDLREIIEHLNESSRTQDNSDPIVQIGRVLNAHMNSLHWIDTMTLNIQNQLENVTKLHDIHRRENERSFRISYE